MKAKLNYHKGVSVFVQSDKPASKKEKAPTINHPKVVNTCLNCKEETCSGSCEKIEKVIKSLYTK